MVGTPVCQLCLWSDAHGQRCSGRCNPAGIAQRRAWRIIDPPLILTPALTIALQEEQDEATRCLLEKRPYVPLWYQRLTKDEADDATR